MIPTAIQAAALLRDAESVSNHSAQHYRYRLAADSLLLWGILWVLGYGGDYYMPAYSGERWTLIDGVGFLLSALIWWRRPVEIRGRYPRLLAMAAMLIGFVIATFAMMPATQGEQIGGFIALLIGVAYMLAGLWLGRRLTVVGAWTATVSLIGYFCLHPYFGLWMAAAGGGGLIAASLWLRRI